MASLLEKMVAQLSQEDRIIFSQLAKRLDEVDGDVSQLSAEQLKIIQKMEEKYAEKIQSVHEEPTSNNESYHLLESNFSNFVRELLARDLKERFPLEEDAVRFAFQNKWIAQELKEATNAQKVFEDFSEDISEANQWRQEVVGIESDKALAVGLTWFMVLFQLNEKLNS